MRRFAAVLLGIVVSVAIAVMPATAKSKKKNAGVQGEKYLQYKLKDVVITKTTNAPKVPRGASGPATSIRR